MFPNIPQIHYVGKRHGNESSASQSADWVYDFVFGDDISIERFAETIHEETAGKSAINVVSHEALLRPYKKYRLLQRVKKLKEYFDEIRIIVSIRNQTEIILSQSVHDRSIFPSARVGDALDFEGTSECKWPRCSRDSRRFFWSRKDECACRKSGFKFINVPYFNYLDLFTLLQSLFGRENVHFIVNEELRKNCANELDRLTRFLGVSPMDPQVIEIIAEERDNVRRSSDLYDQSQREFVSSGSRIAVFDYFREANAVLSELLQLDLKKYGYY